MPERASVRLPAVCSHLWNQAKCSPPHHERSLRLLSCGCGLQARLVQISAGKPCIILPFMAGFSTAAGMAEMHLRACLYVFCSTNAGGAASTWLAAVCLAALPGALAWAGLPSAAWPLQGIMLPSTAPWQRSSKPGATLPYAAALVPSTCGPTGTARECSGCWNRQGRGWPTARASWGCPSVCG